MRDFTLETYRLLLTTLREGGFRFHTFEDYCQHQGKMDERFVILRHDVDLRAANSLRVAQIEAELGIRASYYFRVVPESNQPDIIRQIAALGHEIGYHYEDMSIMHGDVDRAYAHFVEQLSYFRTFYPVKTICMHGAPTSKFDGRDLWKTYDYKSLGIVGEPYFDTDFSRLLYLTDTGRCWDGYRVSVRDKVERYQDEWIAQGLAFHSSDELITALRDTDSVLMQSGKSIMITTHPQRWTSNKRLWWREWGLQSVKNMIKRILIIIYSCR